MQKSGLNDIRERFLKFFESKGHLRLPSFPLVPINDTSILLINAGMTPLKPYFTGKEQPPSPRVTTCQKCIRTPDIENVGKTARHGTFFEMLGNFSFGEYFKKQAILWAWEFVTHDLGLAVDRLWVSVYEEDQEAFDIWNKDVGLPAERIVKMGKEDNFWEHGTGPCGPCSEIYFDRGEDKGCGKPGCVVGCDCDRYIEFWNLVFTQFNRDENGNYSKLKNKNIDTGMGLERLACIMQNVNNLFEVDTIRRILNNVCSIAGVEYGKSDKQDISVRVITDHIRSTTMMVCDGILPSNEGRGYVLRRLLRRAARHGKLLGIEKLFLIELAKVVIDESKEAYPELEEKQDYIMKVIKIEEERFEAALDQGLGILQEYIAAARLENKKILSGEVVFKLHDTYGFPMDLTREIAEENGIGIDQDGFEKEMKEQKEKARSALKDKEVSAWAKDVFDQMDSNIKTGFVGYDTLEAEGTIVYIIKDDIIVETAQQGENAIVVLDKTPFYAESGGQVGDTGYIECRDAVFKVEDCRKTPDGKYLHVGVVQKGIISTQTTAYTKVDADRRVAIAKNHTATHLLQKALRNIVGGHITQAGSYVDPDRLRFDFTHFSAVTPEQLKRVEDEINDIIMKDIRVTVCQMSMDEAKKQGATALFGEKYGSEVRVVEIGDYSMELCGGTHINSTGHINMIKIISEGAVAAGVRRIEALTGKSAVRFLNEREEILNQVSGVLKTSPQQCVRKIEVLMNDIKKANKEIGQLRDKLASGNAGDILDNKIEIEGINVVIARMEQMDMDALRKTGDMLKNKMQTGVVALASGYEGKVGIIVTATQDVVRKGIHSGNIIKEVAAITGGGGGGRPDMAQAGGRDVSRIDEALERAKELIQNQLKKN